MPEIVAKLQQLIHEDRCRKIEDLADNIWIGHGTCQRILTAELVINRVTAKFVSMIPTANLKQQ
jgi:hypothetical protein